MRRWVWSGKVKALKLGHQLYIKKADLKPPFSSNKKIKKVNRLAALERALKLQEKIRQRIGGNIDVLEALEHSRQQHP